MGFWALKSKGPRVERSRFLDTPGKGVYRERRSGRRSDGL